MSESLNQPPEQQNNPVDHPEDAPSQETPPLKITSFKRQNLKPPIRHDSSTNILIFTPNKKLNFIENYIKDKLYESSGN